MLKVIISVVDASTQENLNLKLKIILLFSSLFNLHELKTSAF